MKKIVIIPAVALLILAFVAFSKALFIKSQARETPPSKSLLTSPTNSYKEPSQSEKEELFAVINPLVERIDQTIRAKEKGWKLKSKSVRGAHVTGPDSVAAVMIWKNGSKDLSVNIGVWVSVEKLEEAFHRGIEMIAGGLKQKIDIGDEALLVTHGGGKRDKSAYVTFRKGRVKIGVSGPTKDDTLKFARHIASQIE
jgi:hypothetical protein